MALIEGGDVEARARFRNLLLVHETLFMNKQGLIIQGLVRKIFDRLGKEQLSADDAEKMIIDAVAVATTR